MSSNQNRKVWYLQVTEKVRWSIVFRLAFHCWNSDVTSSGWKSNSISKKVAKTDSTKLGTCIRNCEVQLTFISLNQSFKRFHVVVVTSSCCGSSIWWPWLRWSRGSWWIWYRICLHRRSTMSWLMRFCYRCLSIVPNWRRNLLLLVERLVYTGVALFWYQPWPPWTRHWPFYLLLQPKNRFSYLSSCFRYLKQKEVQER